MKHPKPEFVKNVLFQNAEDLGEIGLDVEYGHGRATTDFLDCGKIKTGPTGAEPTSDASSPSGCVFPLGIGILAGVIFSIICISIYTS